MEGSIASQEYCSNLCAFASAEELRKLRRWILCLRVEEESIINSKAVALDYFRRQLKRQHDASSRGMVHFCRSTNYESRALDDFDYIYLYMLAHVIRYL